MLGHKNLISGVNYAGLDGALLDLGHAVEAGRKHHHQCCNHGGDHDGSATSLDPIQGNDYQFPQRGLENKGQNQKHFEKNRSVE